MQVSIHRYISGTGQFLIWYFELLNRLVELHPDLALAIIRLWPRNEPKTFDKHRMLIWNKPTLFDVSAVADQVVALDQSVFWNPSHNGELLRLPRDRWNQIDPAKRITLEERILAGRDRHEHDDDDKAEFVIRRYDGVQKF